MKHLIPAILLTVLPPIPAWAGEPPRTLRLEDAGLEFRLPASWTSIDASEGGHELQAQVPRPGGREPGRFVVSYDVDFETLTRHREEIEARRRAVAGSERSVTTRVAAGPGGERLEIRTSIKEGDAPEERRWYEHEAHFVAHWMHYTFFITLQGSPWPEVEADFAALLDSVILTPPRMNNALLDRERNRWVDRTDGSTIDLPPGWVGFPTTFRPVGAPGGNAQEAMRLVIGREPHRFEPEDAAGWPERHLVWTSPRSELRSYGVVPQGDGRALETIMDRPGRRVEFERRVPGDGIDYLVTFTCPTAELAAWEARFRASLDSFRPGRPLRAPGTAPTLPAIGPPVAARPGVAARWLPGVERALRPGTPLGRVLAGRPIRLAWFATRLFVAVRQQRAVAAIRAAGGHVEYDYRCLPSGNGVDVRGRSPVPAPILALVGEDLFHDVTQVTLDQSADAGTIMAHLHGLPGLVDLSSNSGAVTDRDLVHLEGSSSLRNLVLTGGRFGDAGLVHLGGLERLVRLDLGGSHVTDAGMPALATLRHLRWLILENTRVGDAGLEALNGLRELDYLALHRTRVTDAGIPTLCRFPKLIHLGLSSLITDEGRRALVAGLPRLKTNSWSGPSSYDIIKPLPAPGP